RTPFEMPAPNPYRRNGSSGHLPDAEPASGRLRRTRQYRCSIAVPPGDAAIRGNDATQGVDICAVQIIKMIRQCFPGVPDRTDQFACDAVAQRGTEEYGEISALAERDAAILLLLQRPLVK